ncbi:hypothetical protein SprV_0100276800 [Sparganum proliferum]
MMARITDNETDSEAFGVTNTVNQGCVHVFDLMFPAMLMDAHRDECSGTRIAYGTEGQLLNSRRMQAPTDLSTTIQDLLFTNDSALNTATEADMRRRTDLFGSGCANFWPPINTDKNCGHASIATQRCIRCFSHPNPRHLT